MLDTAIIPVGISIANPKASVECPEDGLFELVHKRTRTGKSFLLKSGLRRQIVTIGHQHYWDGESWHDVDNSVVESEFGFECNKTSYFWRAHQTGIGCNYKSRLGGFSRMKLLSVGGKTPQQSIGSAKDNCLNYPAIAMDTAFHWQLLASKVSGWVTLHSEHAPREWAWEFIHSGGVGIARTKRGIDSEGRPLEIECDIETEELKPGLYRTILKKRWTGRVGSRNKTTRKMEWSDKATYPVAIDPDISEQIVAEADNGYQMDGSGSGSAWYTSDIKFGHAAEALINCGWRFQTVAVAQADTIDLANFKIYQTVAGTPDASGKMYGYDTDDAAAFSDSKLPDTLAKTSASTTIPQGASYTQQTFAVTAIVQEIVNRGGWSSNNDLSVFVIADSSNQYSYQYFSLYSSPGKHGRLEIDYSGVSGPVATNNVFKLRAVQRASNW